MTATSQKTDFPSKMIAHFLLLNYFYQLPYKKTVNKSYLES